MATGGNPKAIGRLAKQLEIEKDATSVSFHSMVNIVELLSSLTYKQRMKQLGLNEE